MTNEEWKVLTRKGERIRCYREQEEDRKGCSRTSRTWGVVQQGELHLEEWRKVANIIHIIWY